MKLSLRDRGAGLLFRLFVSVFTLGAANISWAITVPSTITDVSFDQVLQVTLPMQAQLSRATANLFDDYLSSYPDTGHPKLKTIIFQGPKNHCRFANGPLRIGVGDTHILGSLTVYLELDESDEKIFEIRHSLCGHQNFIVERFHSWGTDLPPIPWQKYLSQGSIPKVQLAEGELLKTSRLFLDAFGKKIPMFRTEYRKHQNKEFKSFIEIRDTLILKQFRDISESFSEIRYYSPDLQPFSLERTIFSGTDTSRICKDASVFFSWTAERGLRLRIDNVDYADGLSYKMFEEFCFTKETQDYGLLLKNLADQYLNYVRPAVPEEEVASGPSRNKKFEEEIEELRENIEIGLTREALDYLEVLLEAIEDEEILDQR